MSCLGVVVRLNSFRGFNLAHIYCSWIAMNEVDDWTGIHYRFLKTSLGAGQVHRSVRQPHPSLRVRRKRLDIYASRAVADEDDRSFQDSPRGTISILPSIVLFLEDQGCQRVRPSESRVRPSVSVGQASHPSD